MRIWSPSAEDSRPLGLCDIVIGGRAITADTGLRLRGFLGLSDGWWLALQVGHDIEAARDAMAAVLRRILRFDPQPA